ncbi:Golgi-to-ER vesicle coat component [Yamadazyma tenuis]|uniref:Coatomer subunit zeta n=1 Tax=Candida tenuis (strain ATCC 10573 / BCRC 21748 / CBS 615 / JCM 9827 / NBRC 10315 / NRRL Y-1498 / VKM Y-70) TaxID=590646 RepID=G3BEV2_CANTC|nr:snare-like protein [Yamadazyma tenuis ATCC 10573]XP_006690428.1 uncharacterized protein CANTEDRAFT_116677 [Yamadazyma tenuis ATCC 10573]EGV61213.1 snare-like protein [Yamadazyma tenuis ATCC 10573]EGV61214.1 hypothetical protein CANTEDRAFT_116677 [Yamadazyma tenuis ATCC 10573]WEJ94150.1 Golgi-to-ER vesicle coat component [Yamadazyma tenuis]
MTNISLYTITSCLILDKDGKRLYGKYYQTQTLHPELTTLAQQVEFEKKIFDKINRVNQDILLFNSNLVVYKQVNDVLLIIVANLDENESLIYQLLSNLNDSLNILLDNTLDKVTILEKYDMVSLCVDEAIDDGVILEIDSSVLVSRVTNPPSGASLGQDLNLNKIDISEKGFLNALSFASKKIGERLQQGL